MSSPTWAPVGSPGQGSPPREVRVRGALLPGLVNVHCHSPMTLFRRSGEGLPLHQWLNQVLWPQEAHLTEEDVFWGMTLAAAELLRFGVTTAARPISSRTRWLTPWWPPGHLGPW